ncbi:MAG: saccharopine dehydrogenase C-terminal domain-containing protein [bacterium]|nr:saccharopine dehydrogenase C-terminal domain-containing protein [bacterium]
MKYLILGAGPGSMGEAIAARLLKEEGAEVSITDQNLGNVEKTYGKLRPYACGANLKWFLPGGQGLDVVKQIGLLPRFFKDFDIVVSAIPASLNPIVVEAVLLSNEMRGKYHERKTHYCDLGGVLEITKKIIQWDTDLRAKACGVALVPDCGLQPGLGNIIAIDILKNFDPAVPVESIIIYVGGLPYDYKNPPYYKKLFNLTGLAEIYYNAPLVLHKGRPLKITKLSHYETIPTREFDMYFGSPETIKFEAAVTGGLGALPYYLQNQVLTLQEKTLRFEGHYNKVKTIPSEDFEKIFTNWLKDFPVCEKDFTVMKIVAIGKSAFSDERIMVEKLLCSYSDENWNSMQKTTGFTTAVLARLIAEGKASPGSTPPEIALDSSLVLNSLKKDFHIYERTTLLK